MADLNINAKLPVMDASNGFVRENLVKPLQNSQKIDVKDPAKDVADVDKRQTVASVQSSVSALADMPREQLDETISQLNDSLQNVQRNLEFSIDKDIGKIVINVKDRETDEIVRQIPSEEVLQLAKNLHAASERFNEEVSSRSQPATEGVFLKTSV